MSASVFFGGIFFEVSRFYPKFASVFVDKIMLSRAWFLPCPFFVPKIQKKVLYIKK